MTRQNISTGTFANDGSGDTLRQAGQKINENFVELYKKLGGDSNALTGTLSISGSGILFEGATDDTSETVLNAVDPTQDNIISLPNTSGNIVLDSATQTLLNKTLTMPILSGVKLLDDNASHSYNFIAGSLTANHNINIPTLSDSDTLTLIAASQTLTNKTLTSPKVNEDVAVTATATQLNHTVGVTSAIQTQLDTKSSKAQSIAFSLALG